MKTRLQEIGSRPTQSSFSPPAATRIPPVVQEVVRSPGQPLDPATRAFMEQRFGHDFGRIRVHADTPAAESARALNASAYTVGQNIVFGAGQFAPTSYQGRSLLAHELAHTVQQTGLTGGPSTRQEQSAETTARNISQGRSAPHDQPACGVGLSRQPTGETEEEEIEEQLLAEGDPIMARIRETEEKWKKQAAAEKTENAEKAAAHERILFPPTSSATQGLPLLTDEEIPNVKKRRENEANATKARNEKEIAESHERLLLLGGMIAKGATFNKKKLMALITKDSLLDLQLLTRYGLKLPGRFTKQIVFEREVKNAIDRFDTAWRKTYGTGSAPAVGDLTPEKIEALRAEQGRKENEAAGAEGLIAVEASALGGFGAWAASFFTSDPKKITAAANIGAAAGGVATAVGSGKARQIEQAAIRESDRKQESPPIATAPQSREPTAPTPDLPEPPASASSSGAAVVPYAPGGPLDKTQPGMAFEKTEPGAPPLSGPPTQQSVPPADSGKKPEPPRGGPRPTIVLHPPPMPRRPPPPRPIIEGFPQQDGTPVSPEDVLRVLEIDHTRVIWSFNKGNNMNEWSSVRPKDSPIKFPPLAFTVGGKVRVDHDRWVEMGYAEHR